MSFPRHAPMALGLAFVLLCASRAASADDPLYVQTPFDEITLDENNGSVVLKVRLLELPGRKLPAPAQRTGEIEIELLTRPGNRYKVDWAAIKSVTFFEDRLLAEADRLTRGGDYDEAFRYYQFLESRFPQAAGLKEAVENFLWVQIAAQYRSGRLNEALALLVELHQRNPTRTGLSTAYERVALALAQTELSRGNARAARGHIRSLTSRFPATQAAAAPLEGQLKSTAQALLAEAQTHLAAGRGREAWLASRQMLETWPALAGGQALAREIHEQYPVVIVGVTSPPAAVSETSSGAAPGGAARVKVIERQFRDDAAALNALRRGEVSIVDRVSPWEVPRFTGDGITVRPYALPRVHFLLPNSKRPIAASRTLRRAVLYAIDRESILREGLLGGRDDADGAVLSGPLPHGDSDDANIEPLAYDPATAAVLIALAGRDAIESTTAGASSAAAPLVLLHPAEPVARVACQSIANQLALVGLQVALREDSGKGVPAHDWDLQYVEATLTDPADDIRRLLGPKGPTACSPAMLQALRTLEAATALDQQAAALKAIHRRASSELPMIPLWQLVAHFAHHESVQGLGEPRRGLYENIDHWKTELRAPVE